MSQDKDMGKVRPADGKEYFITDHDKTDELYSNSNGNVVDDKSSTAYEVLIKEETPFSQTSSTISEEIKLDVESYIKDTYGSYKVLKNGNYYVKTKDKTEIYIPKELSDTTKVYAFIPGKGGPLSDAKSLRAKVEGSDPGDYLTIIAPNSQDSTDILKQATKIVKDNGSEVKGVVVSGFSLGARQTLPTLNNYLKKHPEQADSSAIIMTDGWIKDYHLRTDLNELKNHNVKMLYISTEKNKMEDKRSPKVKTIIEQLTTNGFNAIGVLSHDYGHQGINNDVVANSFAEFLFNDANAIGNKNVNTRKLGYDPAYEFIFYNTKTKAFCSLFKVGLDKDFSKLDFLRLDFTHVYLIQSDNEFLQLYLTSINTALSELHNSVFKLMVSSTTSVPQIEPGLINGITQGILSLTKKIRADLKTFGKVGNKFSNLDLTLEKESNDLMKDFTASLKSPDPLKIKKTKFDKQEYSLDDLIKDYKNYEKEQKKQRKGKSKKKK